MDFFVRLNINSMLLLLNSSWNAASMFILG